MTTQEAAVALMEWALATAGVDALGADVGLQGGYPYEPLEKSIALPDVVVEIEQKSKRKSGDPRFPQWNIQQALLMDIWEVQLSVLVDVGEAEAENAAAAVQLRTIADTLLDGVWDDLTLGGRFDGTHIEPLADFTPGWIRYPDGSTGRNSTIHLTVAKLVGG